VTTNQGEIDPANRRLRVLVAKVGLDGHDRGVKVVARILRDAGMDVIYTGLHRTAGEVVTAAIQEDVDVIGLSMLSGAHMSAFGNVLKLLRAHDAADIAVVGGGVIPDADASKLYEMGVQALFLQDATPAQIVSRIREIAAARQ
jgi:methylmalonyl-CoA mutase C-terminal domain/subunit